MKRVKIYTLDEVSNWFKNHKNPKRYNGWQLRNGYILKPCRKVRDLVDEYARLKAEFRHVDTERGEGRDIWDRMTAIDLELLELGYVLHETGKAA